jgi:Tol biopolymer transport system component
MGSDAPIWFQAEVDTLSSRESVRGNATTVFPSSFSGGTHVVKLSAVPSFCAPTSDLRASVEVKTGAVLQDTAVATFSLQCEPLELAADSAASIVFERSGHVMTVEESGGSAGTLTIGESPAWSSDGKLISFQRLNCDPSYGCEHDLWLMSPDGSNQRTVSRDENYDDFDAALSPSGAEIAFVRFVPGPDQTYLAVSSLDGSSVKLLSMWYPYSTPSWSPNASHIAFVCQGNPGASLALCLASTDTFCTTYFSNRCNWPAPVPITTSVGDELDPAWSPDGRRIAFTLACVGGLGNVPPSQVPCPAGVTIGEPYIAVIDVATREMTRLVPGHDPTWSADGSRLVFVGNTSSPGLRVYSFSDGSVRQVTDNPLDASPSWR